MAITRSKTPDWSVGEKLTSAQLNALDLNTTYGLDRRSGQSDNLASVVSATAGGRIIPSNTSVPDADMTYNMSNGISFVRIDALSTDRTYTFSNTGAAVGDRVCLEWGSASGASAIIKNAGGTTLIQLGDGTDPSDDGTYAEIVFNGGFWRLANYTTGSRLHVVTFLTSGSWTCPRGITQVDVEIYGGGGGGGGASGFTGTSVWSGGGGGGAGSTMNRRTVDVSPGTTYVYTVGTGGAGGTASAGGTAGNGGAGNDSVFGGGPFLAYGRGAGGGKGGTSLATSSLGGGMSRGGTTANTLPPADFWIFSTVAAAQNFYTSRQFGDGGFGELSNTYDGQWYASLWQGMSSVAGFIGGSGHIAGSNSGSYQGGSSGGGGGGGPSGAGGAGGSGGNGNNGGNGFGGTAGGAGAANTGAGGGGGGAAGCGTGVAILGAVGGAGGSGRIRLFYTK